MSPNFRNFIPVTLICLFILAVIGCFPFDGFKKIPKTFEDPDNLIKAAHPDKAYTYWAFCNWPPEKDSIVFARGSKPTGIKLEQPKILGGLFQGCLPAMCYKYIVYVYNGKVGYVQDAKQLKGFLGRIDNLEEALLLAEATEDLYLDDDNARGGSYFIDTRGYHLRLMHYISCPETKESISLRIQTDSGIVQKTDLGPYFKGKDCIVY